MNKFMTVFLHTYLSKVKKKSFLITTGIFLVFIFLLANINTFVDMFSSEEGTADNTTVAVVSEEQTIMDQLNQRLENGESNFQVNELETSIDDAKQLVTDGTYAGALHITLSEQELPVATYYTNDTTNFAIESQLSQELEQIKVAMAANQAGIDQSTISSIYEPMQFNTEQIEADGGGGEELVKTEEELNGTRGLVYVLLFLLYFAVISYGNMIATDIANEKTSRVMEILISSSSPVSQMFAKILGIGLVGLTQMTIFLGIGYLIITQKQEELVGGFFEVFGLSDVSVSTFVYAFIFFLLGYFLYATLAAMLGSLVSRTEDVQQMMLPVTLLIVAAFMISMIGLSDPSSSFVTISSYIPFFSPRTMFLRVGMLDIPMWEIALSIAILIITIALLAVIGARIYRGGVLMYGTSTSLKDIKKALRLSKKE
ncbi:ABC transporter permease [Gracilibacillus oryzae]|uniref:ABC transporter permease n=1 Tax=Gracilibacillus oryzae TaxID=1672701 RepID=A0A7C8KU73_9BACI|nr:ABC transporter permease [Gracilibacillus oryzae]KAB8139035.1 ABC transporter permease [Gracilibacillus oryzae]